MSKDRTCALLQTGKVQCFGADNVDGVTGLLGTSGAVAGPLGDGPGEMGKLQNVNLPSNATAIASGRTHSCALLDDQSVWCWGGNTFGQLGIGDTNSYQGVAPKDVFGSALKVMSISASDRSTCAVLTDGRVACWGSDTWTDDNLMMHNGVLGLNNKLNPALGDVPAETTTGLIKTVLPTAAKPVSDISGAANGYCIYTTSNPKSVRCWGDNAHGQLGQGSLDNWGAMEPNTDMLSLPRIDFGPMFTPAQIAVGRTHACAVAIDGQLKCFGSNLAGELGLGTKILDGMVSNDYGVGDVPSEMGDSLPYVELDSDRVKQISLGYQLTCVLFQNDRVKCWGKNHWGQTGVLPNDLAVGDDMGPNMMMMSQAVRVIPYVEPF